MSKIIFTKKQIEELLRNDNVVRIGKTIVYSKDFKIKTIELYKRGLMPQEIFRQANKVDRPSRQHFSFN